MMLASLFIFHFIRLSRCRFTTYRHRFARAAPAPRAKRNDSKNRGRASPVKLSRGVSAAWDPMHFR